MKTLAIIVINYRRADLTIGCLASIADQISARPECAVVVIDNASDDQSADAIHGAIESRAWSTWCTLVRSPINGGFAYGNNLGFKTIEAHNYLLLNSDARAMPGSIDALLASITRNPDAGMIGPRLEGPEGDVQVSCFRYRTPVGEMLAAAGTRWMDRLFPSSVVPMGTFESRCEPQWMSFACIVIRREVIKTIGPMDEGYFMYFEDIDYARRARKAGFRVIHDPSARFMHIKGGTSSVKAALSRRSRVPRYYYEARSRYYAKFYGGAMGVIWTNLLWIIGRGVSRARILTGRARGAACAREALDNWTNWLSPLRTPAPQQGGEL